MKPVPRDYSEDVRALTTICLAMQPDDRPRADELLAKPAVRHGVALLPPAVSEGLHSSGALPLPEPGRFTQEQEPAAEASEGPQAAQADEVSALDAYAAAPPVAPAQGRRPAPTAAAAETEVVPLFRGSVGHQEFNATLRA